MPFTEKTLSDTLMELPLTVVLILMESIINTSAFNGVQIFGTCCMGNCINAMTVNINGSLQVRYQATNFRGDKRIKLMKQIVMFKSYS